MKNCCFLLLSLLFPASLFASEVADTIMVSATDVTIVESPTGLSVMLKGSDSNPDYTYSFNAEYPDGTSVKVKNENDFNFEFPFCKKIEKKLSKTSCQQQSQHWSGHSGGFMLGFAGVYNLPDGIKVDMGRSCEFDWLNVIALQYSPGRMAPKFSLGFGFGLRELRTKDKYLYARQDDRVVTSTLPQGSKDDMTTLYGFNVSFPFRICQPLDNGWEIMAAASLDLLTHCSISHRYKIGDEHYSYKWTGVETRTLGYSVIAAIGCDDFGVFCKWTPKGMIKEGYGPQISTISTGIIIGL